jgi:hypothetical protein
MKTMLPKAGLKCKKKKKLKKEEKTLSQKAFIYPNIQSSI